MDSLRQDEVKRRGQGAVSIKVAQLPANLQLEDGCEAISFRKFTTGGRTFFFASEDEFNAARHCVRAFVGGQKDLAWGQGKPCNFLVSAGEPLPVEEAFRDILRPPKDVTKEVQEKFDSELCAQLDKNFEYWRMEEAFPGEELSEVFACGIFAAFVVLQDPVLRVLHRNLLCTPGVQFVRPKPAIIVRASTPPPSTPTDPPGPVDLQTEPHQHEQISVSRVTNISEAATPGEVKMTFQDDMDRLHENVLVSEVSTGVKNWDCTSHPPFEECFKEELNDGYGYLDGATFTLRSVAHEPATLRSVHVLPNGEKIKITRAEDQDKAKKAIERSVNNRSRLRGITGGALKALKSQLGQSGSERAKVARTPQHHNFEEYQKIFDWHADEEDGNLSDLKGIQTLMKRGQNQPSLVTNLLTGASDILMKEPCMVDVPAPVTFVSPSASSTKEACEILESLKAGDQSVVFLGLGSSLELILRFALAKLTHPDLVHAVRKKEDTLANFLKDNYIDAYGINGKGVSILKPLQRLYQTLAISIRCIYVQNYTRGTALVTSIFARPNLEKPVARTQVFTGAKYSSADR